jgi:hypothetical protein
MQARQLQGICRSGKSAGGVSKVSFEFGVTLFTRNMLTSVLTSKDQNVLATIFNSKDGEIVLKEVDSETVLERRVEMEVRQLEMDGMSFAANEKWDESIECFSKAIKIDPLYGTILSSVNPLSNSLINNLQLQHTITELKFIGY